MILLAILSWVNLAQGCHWTNIVVRNGTWCCGEAQQRDVGETGTPPPTEGPGPTTTPDEGPTSTSQPPDPFVGDCPCGNHITGMEGARTLDRVLSQDPYGTEDLNRPWLVQITLKKDSGKMVECTGSLLNMRWIITAAHCFCGNVVKCTNDMLNFKKTFEVGKMEDEEPETAERLGQISLKFGTMQKDKKTMKGVEKLVIHPDYYQFTGDTVVGHTDVALIKTKEDIFGINDARNQTDTFPFIVPICLPPKLNYVVGQEEENEKKGIHEPFEDMDCFQVPENRKSVPYPNREVHINKGWLSCHPGSHSQADTINIMGRNSFISAFGSTARQDFHERVRYQCLTNSYGPIDSIFEYCHGKCHKETREPFEVMVPGYNGTEREREKWANPSLADPICSKFREEALAEALRLHEQNMKHPQSSPEGHVLEERLNFLGWVKIQRKSVVNPGERLEVLCYPHEYAEGLKNARNMWDYPYRHGWCEVCRDKSTHQCFPQPHKDWGWCQPECEEEYIQPEIHRKVHEAAVDAFVYENCSLSVNTFTEFCTGAPITAGYGQIWQYANGKFMFVRNELRQLHEGSQQDGDTIDWNGNGTILRPGSRYQAIQHHQAMGDACYGDAGGSVWKWMMQRDNSDIPDNRVHKLAVLTGVLSRFEEYCGVFRPDIRRHYSKPVQHTIHTRITSILDWINDWIADGMCIPEDGVTGGKPETTTPAPEVTTTPVGPTTTETKVTTTPVPPTTTPAPSTTGGAVTTAAVTDPDVTDPEEYY